jgi:hypothetical protein
MRSMAASALHRQMDAFPERGTAQRREGLRVVGAFVALLAAALLLTSGLLWRENARPRSQPSPPTASAHR